MADASFNKLVPGFDFLETLVKNAGAAMPSMGQWVAPTLNPDELQKRIDELKTVQFWLEQNARMLGVTIQALEVQRMTLSTLKTMNVQMGDLRESMTLRMPGFTEPAAKAPAEPPNEAAAGKPAVAGIVDPMQWWSALTRQFAEIATAAVKDGAGGIARNFGGGATPPADPAAPPADARPAPAGSTAPAATPRPEEAAPAKSAAPARKRTSPPRA